MKFLVVIILTTCSFAIVGQNLSQALSESQILYEKKEYDKAIDLLQTSIEKDNGEIPAISVEARLWLARNYMHSWQTDNALNEYAIAWELSKALENDSMKIEAGMALISMISFHERSDSIRLLTNEILRLNKLEYKDESDLYMLMANYHEDNESLDSAIYYSTKAAIIDSIHQDSSSIPYTYFDLGNYYLFNHDYKNGISKILFGLDYLRGERDLHKKNAIELGLSSVYLKIGNLVKAKELALRSMQSAKLNSQQINLTLAYYYLGSCEAYAENFEMAKIYYMKSDSVNDSKSKNIWRGTRAKAGIISQKLNLNESITDEDIKFINSIDLRNKNKHLKNEVEFLKLRLNEYYQNDFEKDYNKLYLETSAETDLRMRKVLLRIKKEYLINEDRFEEAIMISNQLDRIKKEITTTNNEYIIQDLEAKHRKKEQELTIEYLNKQNKSKDIKVKEQKSKIIIGSIALGLITLLSFFLFQLYQKIRSQKEIIAKSLKEKDLLLREIHHRVKNNLQLVSSLLTMQGRSIDDENTIQAINEGKSRVRSMALIHQDLYNKENIRAISVKEYIEKLTKELFHTYKISDDRIQLEMDIDDIELDVDTVVPLGLIINELVTNSLKYAWPNKNHGLLSIKLKKHHEAITLSIKDDGIGYTPQEVREESFGATLVSALTLQLNGECEVVTENGTKTTISIIPSN